MDDSNSLLDTVILNGWPSCTDCLSWSSDGELAVAAGEAVHILIPKQRSKHGTDSDLGPIGLRDWHTTRIRTNLFSQQEWPEIHDAPSHNFSIGEEQSLSTVAALAWSPPGLGPHRRSVLAVLTSNFVLSIWESDGRPGEWKRVVVVNHHLGDHFGWVDESGNDFYRYKRRIRAFTWSPKYRIPEGSGTAKSTLKWGVIHLAVANDDETVIILKASGSGSGGKKEWTMQAICDIQLPAASSHGKPFNPASLFQKAMTSTMPVAGLDWSDFIDESQVSVIKVSQRYRKTSIKIQSSPTSTSGGSTDFTNLKIQFDASSLDVCEQNNGHLETQNRHVADNAELRRKMEEACMEFDSNHGLDGTSIFKEWGFASSDGQDAACITLHPSDMVEYTTAAMEKCTLLFAPRDEGIHRSRIISANPIDVLGRLCNWILCAANECPLILDIDRHLLGVSATYAALSNDECLKQKANLALIRLLETSPSPTDHDEMDANEPASAHALTGSDMETCLICEAHIPFDRNDLNRVRCGTGHPYTRCSLSLLTIQEPGISKYCSQCDRQFLNAEEINLQPTQTSTCPSLVALLFEEFDVCPYCGAKFRA